MNDDVWLYRAIKAVFDRQTLSEQSTEHTYVTNGVGFNKPDSSRLSYYASWIQRHGKLDGLHKDLARKKMLKYAGQLAKIANGVA